MHIIGGKFKQRRLTVPRSSTLRPTMGLVREALFNICQEKINGAFFLDLFSGTGAMGCEAVSRGAAHVTFIEKFPPALAAIQSNIMQLAIHRQTHVIKGDVLSSLRQLAKQKKQYHFIYIDPPYLPKITPSPSFPSLINQVLKQLDNHNLLTTDGRIFIEKRDSQSSCPLSLRHLIRKKTRRFGRSLLEEWCFHSVNSTTTQNSPIPSYQQESKEKKQVLKQTEMNQLATHNE